MRKHVTTILGLLILALVACGPDPRPLNDETCAGYFPSSEGGIGKLCDGSCTDLATDPTNCGRCGNACGAGANACIGGQCVCSSADGSRASKAACSWPTDCDDRDGLCLTPDPAGAHCDEIEGIGCADPQRVCIAGYCTLPDCNHPEICNLKDDDCDGLIDQIALNQPLTTSCYEGPPGTAGIGICLAGQESCVAGAWTPCQYQVLPQTETGLLDCDGLDNDCNGCVDDHLENGMMACGTPMMKSTDVTFMIDNSGSMYDKIMAVIVSIGSFGNTYQTASWIHWGAESISDVPPSLVHVYQPLTSFSNFNAAMASFPTSGGGTEPTYDAAYDTATGVYDAALMPTASAQQIYVIFTDETAQTIHPTPLDEHATCQAIQAKGAILVVFTLPEFYADWDECAILYPLSSDAADMTSHLDDLFQLVCTL